MKKERERESQQNHKSLICLKLRLSGQIGCLGRQTIDSETNFVNRQFFPSDLMKISTLAPYKLFRIPLKY